VRVEIEEGNDIVTNKKPELNSPLGAIPKPDGGIRLIHDCSRPVWASVNSYAQSLPKCQYQTLDDATKLVTPRCFMAKVDLKAAYRSVGIGTRSPKATGLKFELDGDIVYMYDAKLPLGRVVAQVCFIDSLRQSDA
jgi:hypothetical protein